MTRKLQAEIKQSKPFTAIEEEVILNIARTAEYFSARIAEVLKPTELTPTQYNALRILRGAGTDGLACGEIGERMVTKDSDITRLLDRLERRGLIHRERPENNRRVVLARITAEGLRILRQIDRPLEDSQRALLRHLEKQQLNTLNELLEACRPEPE